MQNSMCWIQVKADVETQGDFVQSLATEVRAASFSTIDDLVAFVNWLDEELSFLVCRLLPSGKNLVVIYQS
jgi:hypothetical protein